MSPDPPKAGDEAGTIEVGLLTLIFDLHPEHLSAAELVRRMEATDRGEGGKAEAAERALGRLRHAELVRETNGVIVPTRAALHFDQLPF